MSGFRKFRTTLHRRRRSIEAVELGYLTTGIAKDPLGKDTLGTGAETRGASDLMAEASTTPLEFSVSAEAREIGPNPIAWLKPRKSESDN